MKSDINSILLANWYLTICKLRSRPNKSNKIELARKYLLFRINKALLFNIYPKGVSTDY